MRRYRNRISGPIYDRMDLCVQAYGVLVEHLQNREAGVTSEELRSQVMRARKMQERRYKGTGIYFNSGLGAAEISHYCSLEKEEEAYIGQVFSMLGLSARAYHRVLKIARTIADLEESEKITRSHLSEAMSFRGWEG